MYKYVREGCEGAGASALARASVFQFIHLTIYEREKKVFRTNRLIVAPNGNTQKYVYVYSVLSDASLIVTDVESMRMLNRYQKPLFTNRYLFLLDLCSINQFTESQAINFDRNMMEQFCQTAKNINNNKI